MLRTITLLSVASLAQAADTLTCLQDSCKGGMTACRLNGNCRKLLDCMKACKDDTCQTQCFDSPPFTPSTADAVVLAWLGSCGGAKDCFHYGAEMAKAKEMVKVESSSGPCCDKECPSGQMKVFSTDSHHGFCGETCIGTNDFDKFHHFEGNLTRTTQEHPCREQWTPSNTKQYTDYFQTVTHGLPGVLAVTLDLYAPSGMPDHSCCNTPLFPSLNCVGIPGKPQSMTIFGTGPYCCPSSATEASPCGKSQENIVV